MLILLGPKALLHGCGTCVMQFNRGGRALVCSRPAFHKPISIAQLTPIVPMHPLQAFENSTVCTTRGGLWARAPAPLTTTRPLSLVSLIFGIGREMLKHLVH